MTPTLFEGKGDMIPSDHFVYFYNEIFKELEKLGSDALDRYYACVAERQAYFTLESFKKNGLRGMYDYWERIRIEENCDLVNELNEKEGYYMARMRKCPSITKALESDAGTCLSYCNHCPGWVLRVLTKAGYYGVYDIRGRALPRCDLFITQSRALAEKKKKEWIGEFGTDFIYDNLDKLP